MLATVTGIGGSGGGGGGGGGCGCNVPIGMSIGSLVNKSRGVSRRRRERVRRRGVVPMVVKPRERRRG